MTGLMGLYLGSFLFGGLLIGTSVFFGDGDGDGDMDKDFSMDKDLSLDVDADMDGDLDGIDGMAWMPFMSLRFWTFALGLFGMSGIILTTLGTAEPITMSVSAVMGIGMGYPIAYLFQKLKYDSVSAETSLLSYEDELARTLLPMKPNGQGKVRVRQNGELTDLIAMNTSSVPIKVNQEVVILEVKDGIAQVTGIEYNV